MPHVVVRMYAGRSEQQKDLLAKAITQALIDTLGSAPGAISVGVEDIKPEDWMEKVYRPEITEKLETIRKRPGYGPAAES